MSEYAVVKSFLSCLSSSFAFSVNPAKDRARIGSILNNVSLAIDHKGLSAGTQKLLLQVFQHLKEFEAEKIDSTELDFLIDEAKRAVWQTEDCGIRVFVDRPTVLMAVVMSYNLALLSQHLFEAADDSNKPDTHSISDSTIKDREQKNTCENAKQDCESGKGKCSVLTNNKPSKAKKQNVLTAKSLLIRHEQLSNFQQPSTEVVYNKNNTRISYSRSEILDHKPLLSQMPDFSVLVWTMGIVKAPIDMITPPTTPTSPNFPLPVPGTY